MVDSPDFVPKLSNVERGQRLDGWPADTLHTCSRLVLPKTPPDCDCLHMSGIGIGARIRLKFNISHQINHVHQCLTKNVNVCKRWTEKTTRNDYWSAAIIGRLLVHFLKSAHVNMVKRRQRDFNFARNDLVCTLLHNVGRFPYVILLHIKASWKQKRNFKLSCFLSIT